MLADRDDQRLAVGLARLAVAMRAAGDAPIPADATALVDAQILLVLGQRGDPCPVDQLAGWLGMAVPRLVAAVGRLRGEGLLRLEPAPSYDPSQVRVSLTGSGRAASGTPTNWAAHLLGRLPQLTAEERVRLLATVRRHLHRLQRRDAIPTDRLCRTCRYFEPYAHPGRPRPHHCALVDAPLGPGPIAPLQEDTDGRG